MKDQIEKININSSADNCFYLIAGTGHCGTKWLSKVLHRPHEKMVCYHEEKLRRIPLNWKESLRHEFEKGIDGLFDDYFSFINHELKNNISVGDSNSWTMVIIPEIAKIQKIHRIIYLVRNGIQAVHSYFYHNIDTSSNDFLFNTFLRRYWEIVDRPWNDWDKYTRWASWCLWWRINKDMPKWLSSYLDMTTEVIVYRIEELLEYTNLLRDIVNMLNPYAKPSKDELRILQETDTNRKIQGDRSPSALWGMWSDEQRSIFNEICGPTMEQYGYEFPPFKILNKPSMIYNLKKETYMRKILDTCKQLETNLPLTSKQIFEEFNLLSGHPWEETAKSDITTYYPCLYGIVQNECPRRILEIGTAFGLSGATLLKASPDIELFISLDLGIYGEQLGFSYNNIYFARHQIHSWCSQKGISLDRIRFYCANTQPIGKGDNENAGVDIPRWHQIPELVRLLEAYEFDVIFVDGKHTEDGLLNDLRTFWPFLKPGGLVICDDLHDRNEYKDIFPWAGDTLDSFNKFIEEKKKDISDYFIWNYPQVPPGCKLGLRPFGLIRKKQLDHEISSTHVFEVFDHPEAIKINIARQDHLASIGLDLYKKSVLEVGAGVGWHTGFFEKLGCSILSTDARPENVEEHRRRYPYRKVEIADLSIPGSHSRFGQFDVVYCYGTLYHLKDPALCIQELSKICSELFLIETCVNPIDNGKINLVKEDKDNPNQSYEGIGCRPGRDWIMSELKKYFPYVYLTVTQPDHADFPLSWPAILPPGVQNARSVFVASRIQLNLPTLSDTLLEKQSLLEPIANSTRDTASLEISITPDKDIIDKPQELRDTLIKNNVSLIQKIKESVRKFPVLGYFIWWVYMILKTPKKISELFGRLETLEEKIRSLYTKDK